MHPCESFLCGAPRAYFDAPQGAPCTPVEGRWSNSKRCQSIIEKQILRICFTLNGSYLHDKKYFFRLNRSRTVSHFPCQRGAVPILSTAFLNCPIFRMPVLTKVSCKWGANVFDCLITTRREKLVYHFLVSTAASLTVNDSCILFAVPSPIRPKFPLLQNCTILLLPDFVLCLEKQFLLLWKCTQSSIIHLILTHYAVVMRLHSLRRPSLTPMYSTTSCENWRSSSLRQVSEKRCLTEHIASHAISQFQEISQFVALVIKNVEKLSLHN